VPFTATDHAMMARALRLAKRGLYTTQPNPRVGCVLVREGVIVGEGHHQYAGGPHAEINALVAAGDAARGATAYVTLEPCSHTGKTGPCTRSLIQARVARVVVAMEDPNPLVSGRGIRQLRDQGIAVDCGLLEAEARALNPGFIKRMTVGRPWVRVKMAMSLDGRTAMASGESMWITGPAAREDVQRLRARSGAIMTGIGTVLADNPSMNLRISPAVLGSALPPSQPLRVILDSDLRTPPDANILRVEGRVLIIHDCDDARRQQTLIARGAALVRIPRQHEHDRLDLPLVLKVLAEHEVSECHVEAGATLAGALLEQSLVDELIVYMAPHLMGDQGRGLATLPGISTMNERIALQIREIMPVGQDWRITARPACQP